MVHIVEKTKETLKKLVGNDPFIKKFSKEKEEGTEYAQDGE
jgi:hypothetical protein